MLLLKTGSRMLNHMIEENYEFLRSMKHQRYGFEPDKLAGELHQQVFQIID